MDSPTPPKCLECLKVHRHNTHAGCRVCRGLEIEETLLCDLNRRIQKPALFHCHAFQPRLQMAGPVGDSRTVESRPTPPRSQLQFIIYIETDGEKSLEAIVKNRLQQDARSFASLRMTSAGLRMTDAEGKMTAEGVKI